MAKADPHFRLRIPAELKAEIEKSAKANNRSLNAEIVNRLETGNQYPLLLESLLNSSERNLEREKESIRFMRAMNEQVKVLGAILEYIASTDGNLDAEWMEKLRALTASKGQGLTWLEEIESEKKVDKPGE